MPVRPGGAEDPYARILRVVSAQEAGFRRAFLRMVREILDANSLQQLEELLAAGNITAALEVLDSAAAAFATQGSRAFIASAESTAAFLSNTALTVTVAFDQTNTRAVNQMAQNRLRLVTDFTEEQTRVTRNALIRGIATGQAPRDQARTFRESIGLTNLQTRHVNNLRAQLDAGRHGQPLSAVLDRRLIDGRQRQSIRNAIRDNNPLPDEQKNRIVQRYQERYIKYRSEVIARTEAQRMVNAGNFEMYQQGIDMNQFNANQVLRQWVSANDDRVRDSHIGLNGQIRAQGETWQTFNGELRYPCDPNGPAEETIQCRCGVGTQILDAVQVQTLLTPEARIEQQHLQALQRERQIERVAAERARRAGDVRLPDQAAINERAAEIARLEAGLSNRVARARAA